MEKQNQRETLFLDYIFAKEIVYDAYSEEYINWNIYQMAIEKIRKNMNGDWMFINGVRPSCV
jgi:hypothetical protein